MAKKKKLTDTLALETSTHAEVVGVPEEKFESVFGEKKEEYAVVEVKQEEAPEVVNVPSVFSVEARREDNEDLPEVKEVKKEKVVKEKKDHRHSFSEDPATISINYGLGSLL